MVSRDDLTSCVHQEEKNLHGEGLDLNFASWPLNVSAGRADKERTSSKVATLRKLRWFHQTRILPPTDGPISK
ncbi:hypothetical protein GCM10023264_18920 [Sphingomonas daechungensis]